MQSDGQDTITFVFTSLSPSSHFAPLSLSLVATKPMYYYKRNPFASIHRMAWEPNQTTKMSPSQVPRSRSCCVLERVFRSMYKRVVSYFSVTWWIRRDGCTRVDRECNSPEAWGAGVRDEDRWGGMGMSFLISLVILALIETSRTFINLYALYQYI